MNLLSHELSLLPPIHLEEMHSIRLMNRIDTKFITSSKMLPLILQLAENDYFVQDIETNRNPEYHTIYLDTPDREMYISHQNGKKDRKKVRFRTYLTSNTSYFEVKHKNNRGRTNKKRIQISHPKNIISEGGAQFVYNHSSYQLHHLVNHLENRFHRITLVNKNRTERLTIDTHVRFLNHLTGNRHQLEEIAIIELKRDGNVPSPMFCILRDLRIAPVSISKYCIGSALTDTSLKQNRFKIKIREIERIQRNYK
ncbi:VTC domain-containing protein [Bacteroides sp. 214]|uniref:polyphosphate polymerase domain-containing protein n=1 Tax=Bacteroides sp. 214 TaxID=2302935 RepID=UPI0013D8C8CF|nr:polyphosphate polymerase domain-containing protein [Bacteroides sp. 214]NDW12740.1 VTC domain-containing protein [Bacteroides sp. 214]